MSITDCAWQQCSMFTFVSPETFSKSIWCIKVKLLEWPTISWRPLTRATPSSIHIEVITNCIRIYIVKTLLHDLSLTSSVNEQINETALCKKKKI